MDHWFLPGYEPDGSIESVVLRVYFLGSETFLLCFTNLATSNDH